MGVAPVFSFSNRHHDPLIRSAACSPNTLKLSYQCRQGITRAYAFMSAPSLVWFRSDLRLADNPAVAAAVELGGPVLPVFVWAPEEESPWEPGAASRWWLHQSLGSLEKSLEGIGSRLIIRRGASLATLQTLMRET